MKHERRTKTEARAAVTPSDLRFLLKYINSELATAPADMLRQRAGQAREVELIIGGGVTPDDLPPDAMRDRLWRLLRDPHVQARRKDLRSCAERTCRQFFFADEDREQYCSKRCRQRASRPSKAKAAQQKREWRQLPMVKDPSRRRKVPSRAE